MSRSPFRNPFEKYLTKEDHLQMQVAKYINLQYPDVLWNHCPNEGKRTAFERYKVVNFGIRAGMPDIMIFKEHDNYRGLAIELKIGKNKATKLQLDCLRKLQRAGWLSKICYTFEDAIKIIDLYMK